MLGHPLKRGRPKRKRLDHNREDLESIRAVATDAGASGGVWYTPATPHQWEQVSRRRFTFYFNKLESAI